MTEIRKQIPNMEKPAIGYTTTNPEFNVAKPGQWDLIDIHTDRRVLIIPDGEEIVASYFDLAESAGFTPLQRFDGYGEGDPLNGAVALEIPRDMRTLRQVVLATGGTAVRAAGDSGIFTMSPQEVKLFGDAVRVFGMAGNLVHDIAAASGKLLAPSTVGLQYILYSRMEDTVTVTPPLVMVDDTVDNRGLLAKRIHDSVVDLRKGGARSVSGEFVRALNSL